VPSPTPTLSAIINSVTDRQTDSMMPIADQYDRLKGVDVLGDYSKLFLYSE